MSREIIFRGKRIDNGKWVCGDLAHFPNKTMIDTHKHGQPWRGYTVNPETVGQYTGLFDKNGKKIFEGDIIKTHSGLLGKVVYGSFFDDEYCGDACGWFWIGKDRENHTYKLALSSCWGEHKVIGNIHNNPKLLKEV